MLFYLILLLLIRFFTYTGSENADISALYFKLQSYFTYSVVSLSHTLCVFWSKSDIIDIMLCVFS